MQIINDVDSFFDDNIFEEQLIFYYYFNKDTKVFDLITDDPNDNSSKRSNNRTFLKLRFEGVYGYERLQGKGKLKQFGNSYKIDKRWGALEIQELTVGYEERSNKLSFFLYTGITHGEINFYFKKLKVEYLETIYDQTEEDILKGNILYLNKKTNKKVDFYNLAEYFQ